MSSAALQAWAVTFFAGVEEGLAEKERSRLESFLLGMMTFRADPALWGNYLISGMLSTRTALSSPRKRQSSSPRPPERRSRLRSATCRGRKYE